MDQHVGPRRAERQEIRHRAENSGDPPVHQAGDPHHDRLQSTWLRCRQVGQWTPLNNFLDAVFLGHTFISNFWDMTNFIFEPFI